MTLRGPNVVLEPLDQAHAEALLEAGSHASIWVHLAGEAFATLDDARSWIAAALDEQATGARIAFAILDAPSRLAIGSTSYLEIRRPHRALEIGWTWITPAFQRSAVNTQCKQSLLRHAFEELGAVRVQFKTDARNTRSQSAIERIGAVREGVLRRSMTLPDGYVRDSVYYSIIDSEWPGVRERLEQLR